MDHNMRTTEKLITLVDLLQTTIDEHIQEHELLLDAHVRALEENEELRDVIARLMQEQKPNPETN